MARCLFTVADIWTIQGRGIVLAPGISPIDDERFESGDPLLLKEPDGSEITVRIDSLERPYPNPMGQVFVFLRNRGKEEISIGTEVWSVDEAQA